MEHKGLFSGGINICSVEELYALCVEKFKFSSDNRHLLFESLSINVLVPLQSIGLQCNVLIDGSFLTEKANPNDIDLVIITDFDNLSEEQQIFFIPFLDPAYQAIFKSKTNLHVFFCKNNDIPRYNYWTDWFTHDRYKVEKGCAVIEVNGGVQL